MELPLCGECGAAPSSRQEMECLFCGAVLPWEIWDEISRERVEVVEAEATSLLGAMVAVERSKEFRKAAGPMRRIRRRRLRKMRERAAAGQSAQPNDQMSPAALLTLGGLWAVFAIASSLSEASRGTALRVAVVLVVLGVGVVWLLPKLRDPKKARKRGRRRRRRRPRKPSTTVPLAVLAVSHPQTLPGMPEGLRRKATLYFMSGNQRVVITDPDVELTPGQVGYGVIRGLTLDKFHSMYEIPVHPKVEAGPHGAGSAAQ